MAGRQPEERVRVPLLRQEWRDVTFLHWAVDPAALRPLIPAPLVLDTFDGRAWVGLTPLRIVATRPPGVPAPLGSSFPETNLRTYVRLPDGRDAIWFLSLDTPSVASVVGGRLGVGLPYQLARARIDGGAGGALLRYRLRRRGRRRPRAAHDIALRPGPPLAPADRTTLDDWLVGRWRAVARPLGRLAAVATEHEPWPLQRCEVDHVEETLFAAAGLDRPPGPPLAHVSPGVSARLGPPRP